MFKPQFLLATFGLARLQEEKVWRRNNPSRYYMSNIFPNTPKPSNMRLPHPGSIPRLPTPQTIQIQPEPTQKYPYPINILTPTRCKKEEKMDYVTTMIRGINLFIGVISPEFTCYKAWSGNQKLNMKNRWKKTTLSRD